MSNKPTVRDKMISLEKFPVLESDATLKNALDAMTKGHIGVACFVDSRKQLVGVLTDGDIRRLILTKQNPLPALLVSRAIDFGSREPISVKESESIEVAITLMHDRKIWDLPVVDGHMKILGLVHRHDLN